MRKNLRLTRLASAVTLATGLGVGLLAAPAWATPGQAQTFHNHGSSAYDQLVIDFLPIDSPPGISLPGDCWFPSNDAFMSVSGNQIFHENFNKTGDWFTTTFTGDAAVYPIVFESPGVPQLDENGNDVVDTSGTPAATGHLTVWTGGADNNKNSVHHATLTFNGTDASGNPVSMQGHFQFATNAAGDPTATVGSLTC
jgi:hypothetical protein